METITDPLNEASTIDEGESIVATIGIWPFITQRVEKLTAQQKRDIPGLPGRVAKLAKSLCRDTLSLDKPYEPSYRTALDELSRPMVDTQIEAMLNQLPPADDPLSAMRCAEKIYTFLTASLPKSVYESAVNAESLSVADVDYWRWLDYFQLAQEPLYVFQLMATGELLPSQVHGMHAMYPTLSNAIGEAIKEATTNELASLKSYELPEMAEFGVRTWFGIEESPIEYQVAYSDLASQKNSKPNPSQQRTSVLASESLSASEAAQSRGSGLTQPK